MALKRALAALAITAAAVGIGNATQPASASAAASRGKVAVPANDRFAGAVNVAHLPFAQSLNTSKATTDADDVQVNSACGAPNTNASVWYKYTAPSNPVVITIDTAGTDYAAGVIVASGTPGNLVSLACGPQAVRFAPFADTTYYILAFDATTTGGNLHLSIHGPGPAPANDSIRRATSIHLLPYDATVDTTGATSDATDDQLNASCQAPSATNTVWYRFVAGAHDTTIAADASASDYPAGVAIATGHPGALTLLTCAPGGVAATVNPGTTYYVQVFDVFASGGGTLHLHVDLGPTVSFALPHTVALDRSGTATLHFTYTCNRATDVLSSGGLVEIVGRQVAQGGFGQPLDTPSCDGHAHPFDETATSSPVAFRAGSAALLVNGFACQSSSPICVAVGESSVVSLTRSHAAALTLTSVSTTSRFFRRPVPTTRHAYGWAARAAAASWGR